MEPPSRPASRPGFRKSRTDRHIEALLVYIAPPHRGACRSPGGSGHRRTPESRQSRGPPWPRAPEGPKRGGCCGPLLPRARGEGAAVAPCLKQRKQPGPRWPPPSERKKRLLARRKAGGCHSPHVSCLLPQGATAAPSPEDVRATAAPGAGPPELRDGRDRAQVL